MVTGQENPRKTDDISIFNKNLVNYIDNSARMTVNNRNKQKWNHPETRDRVNLMHMNEG